MHEMKTLGGDSVGIPFLFLHCLADFLGVPEFLSVFLQLPLVVQGKGGMKTTIRQNATKALPVANARVTVSGFEICLIASYPPTVVLARFDETAVLNTRVPPSILKSRRRSKSFIFKSLQIMKVFPLVGFSLDVWPTIAPSLTLQNLGSPSHPFKVFPSKRFFSA